MGLTLGITSKEEAESIMKQQGLKVEATDDGGLLVWNPRFATINFDAVTLDFKDNALGLIRFTYLKEDVIDITRIIVTTSIKSYKEYLIDNKIEENKGKIFFADSETYMLIIATLDDQESSLCLSFVDKDFYSN